MAWHAPTARSMSRGVPNTLQTTVLPAQIGGIDARKNMASNDPMDLCYGYNIVPAEFGLVVREGFREWQIDIETAPSMGLGVRTVLPFKGAQTDGTGDKLFCTTNEGIWDITTEEGTPSLALGFSDTTDAAGWGEFIHYTTTAGTIVMLLADSANGLFSYDPVGDTWAQAVGITGPTITDIVFVVEHKQRIWLIEKDSTVGWYLGVGAVTGAATAFYFGGKFKHGGDLVGLYNWTLDDASGLNDRLVAVSRAGDVLVYQGADPSAAATWDTVGTFFLGAVPEGRRIGSEFGGDLHLLTSLGISAMSEVITGVANTGREQEHIRKIAGALRGDMTLYSDEMGWEIRFSPDGGTLLVGTPQRSDGTYIQYDMNTTVKGWAFWRGVPMVTSESWKGAQMFGTEDNRVCRMDTTVDNATIADPTGEPVQFSVLGNFLDMGQPGLLKFGQFVKPNFLSTQEPAYEATLRYDYDIEEMVDPGYGPLPPADAWDAAVWDTAVWGSGMRQYFSKFKGTWGPGRVVAVALRGSAIAKTTLLSYGIMWKPGGPF